MCALLTLLLVPGCNEVGTGATDGGQLDAKAGDGKGPSETGTMDKAIFETAPPDKSLTDGLPPLVIKPKFTINGDPSSTHGYATTTPGSSLKFASVVNCAAAYSCTYAWDFGNGSKGSGITPASVTYAKAGQFPVTLKVLDSKAQVVGSASGMVTVWTGSHGDSFSRTQMDWANYLWLKPVDTTTIYTIKSGWVYTKQNKGAPGSTALMSSAQCKDTQVSVTLRRHPVATEEHYANLLLRVHPGKRTGSYYRVQVKQGTAANGNELALEIYKVTSDQNQLGSAISTAPAILNNFDKARTQDIRLTVTVTDSAAGVPTFTVKAAAASSASTTLLQLSGVKDSGSTPHSYAGFVGLAHYKGEVSFDNFSLSSTVTAPGDAGVTDASPQDAGPANDAGSLDMGVPPDAAQPDTVPTADLPPPDLGPPPAVTPTITINGTSTGFATVTPGTSLTFAATLSCPVPYTCLYKWNFGNGKTATGKTPTAVSFPSAGMFHVKLTVTDSTNYPMGTATAVVTVWSGTMTDNFNRTAMDWTKDLWIKPLDPKAVFSIKSNWLYTKNNLQKPGSGAILAGPLVKNLHLEVTVKRSPLTTVVHYSDVILRMHPTKLNGSFYRVRIKEGLAVYNNEVDLEIFKIISSSDEHGISIVPTPPVASGYDPTRTKDIRVIIDLKNDASGIPTFDVVFAEAANTSKILLQLKGLKDTNTTAPAHSYPGLVGLTQFDGETSFDNLSLKELP